MDRRSRFAAPRAGILVALACATGILCRADQPDRAGFDPFGGAAAGLGKPVAITAVVEPGAGGRPDVLAVTATLEEGWHLYSITQPPGGPLATVITLDADSPRRLAGSFAPDAEPLRHEVDGVPAWKGLVLEEHAGRVTWRAPLEPGAGEVRGTVSLQLCQQNACTPPDTFPFTAAAPDAAGPAGGAASPPAAATMVGLPWPTAVFAVSAGR